MSSYRYYEYCEQIRHSRTYKDKFDWGPSSFILVTFFVSKFFYGETITAIKYYTTALDVVGFAINFFLYTVSGKEFRTQLLRIVCGNDKTSGYSRGKVCFCVKREHPDADKGQFMRIDNGRTVEAASMETHL